jgi:hypothetical protein
MGFITYHPFNSLNSPKEFSQPNKSYWCFHQWLSRSSHHPNSWLP